MTGPGRDENAADQQADERADEPPAVPLLKTWRGVYWFVFAWFVALVVALACFTWVFTE